MSSGLWHPDRPDGYCPWAEGSIRCDAECLERDGCILFDLIGGSEGGLRELAVIVDGHPPTPKGIHLARRRAKVNGAEITRRALESQHTRPA